MSGDLKFSFTKDYKAVTEFLDNTFSSPTHYPDWNLVVSEIYNTEFVYQVCYKNGMVTGICPYHIKESLLTKEYFSGPKNLLIPYGGWIFKEDELLDAGETLRTQFSHLKGFTLPLLKDFKVNYSFSKKSEFKTLVINLRDSEEDIWKNCINSKRRNMIRKAQKNEVLIKESQNKEINIKEFYEIYSQSNNRLKLEVFPEAYFEKLFSTSSNINFRYFTAEHKETIYSGLMLVYNKDVAIYWIGFTKEDAPNLGFGEILQWSAITFSRNYGCKYYDLCTVEKERLPKIYEFKSDFAKEEVIFYGYWERKEFINYLNKFKDLPSHLKTKLQKKRYI